jgi:MFS transporter, OFA family, oxalate/formate antiporter
MIELKNRGRHVLLAALGINLALGILYTWSIFKGAIKTSIESGGEGAFTWSLASLNDPYAVCTMTFALSMIPAGILQDRKGPGLTAFIGGILVALGFILVSLTTSYPIWILGFGIMVGTGIGFGYSASTPAALKWFPRRKSGFVTGIVVSGFGLASLYIAPLATLLLGSMGIQSVLLIFGLAFLLIVCGLSFFLKNPPARFDPEEQPSGSSGAAVPAGPDAPPSRMLRSPAFYLLWLLYFTGAGAGLMVIGSVAVMAKSSLGNLAFIAVAIMAVGNAGGRIAAGFLSDRIGRNATLVAMLLFQAVLMFTAIPLVQGTNAVLLVLLATFIGFNYGSNLSIFPSFAKSFWGMKNFGVNYGLLFTAWGFGGFVMSRLSQTLAAVSGSYTIPFIIAGVMLLAAAGLTSVLKRIEPLQN